MLFLKCEIMTISFLSFFANQAGVGRETGPLASDPLLCLHLIFDKDPLIKAINLMCP